MIRYLTGVSNPAVRAIAQHFGADTADGTFLSFAGRAGQDNGVRRLERWLDRLFTFSGIKEAQ